MHSTTSSACPKCGRTDASIVSSRPAYPVTDLYREREPVGTDYVLQCPCGCAFTRSVSHTAELAVAKKNQP